MRDTQVEKRIQAAMEHAAPKAPEAILSACLPRHEERIIVMEKKKTYRWKPLAAAAVLAIFLCGGFAFRGYRSTHAVASVVSLDVNPSIELQVNEKERVLAAKALNAEAQEILGDMDFTGANLNVAVNAIVGSLLQHGYLDSLSSAILISVEDDNADRAARLQQSLSSEVDAALQNASAGAAVLSQTLSTNAQLETLATQSSISVGKAALIERVRELNNALDFDALAALNVEELKQLLETGAPGIPIGTQAAADAALAYAGVSASDSTIYWEVDPELDEYPAHYEVDLHTQNGEFEYRIDGYSGTVLSGVSSVLSISRPSSGTASGNAGSTAGSAGSLTSDEAAAIALAHAGISSSDALGLRVKLDRDDGITLYEVDFRCSGVEYEYDIKADDGSILKAEQDVDDDWTVSSAPVQAPVTSSSSILTAQEAEDIALAHAGISASDAYSLKCKLDWEDGVQVYEVEFKSGRMEYEYEINAASGDIRKAEKDYDD